MDPLTDISLGVKALSLLKRFWYVVPIAAMAGFLWLQSHRLAARDASIEALKTEKVQLEDRNSVTQASLDAANGKIGELNADALARAARYQADLVDARATEAALRERARRTDATIASLEAAAADASRDPCTVSPEALSALKEL